MKNLLLFHVKDEKYVLLGPYIASLRLCGVKLTDDKDNLLWYIASIFPLIDVILILVIIKQMVENWGDYNEFVPLFALNIVAISGAAKIVFTILNRKLFKELNLELTNFEQDVYNCECDYEKKALNDYRSYIIATNIRLIGLTTITAISWWLLPICVWLTEMVTGNTDAVLEVIFHIQIEGRPKLSSSIGYLCDIFCYFYSTIIHCSVDSYLIALLCFVAGQLKIIELNLTRLFDIEPQHRLDEIARIHKKHLFLIKFSKKLNGAIRLTMLVYFSLASITLCALVIEAPMIKSLWVAIQRVATVLVIIVKVNLVFWHGNEVLIRSENLMDGAYNSEWYNQEPETRKAFHILMMGLTRPIVFSAGPFHNMTNKTFLLLLKATYSLLTLILNTSN